MCSSAPSCALSKDTHSDGKDSKVSVSVSPSTFVFEGLTRNGIFQVQTENVASYDFRFPTFPCPQKLNSRASSAKHWGHDNVNASLKLILHQGGLLGGLRLR